MVLLPGEVGQRGRLDTRRHAAGEIGLQRPRQPLADHLEQDLGPGIDRARFSSTRPARIDLPG
jgi:hypothetical protein